MVCLICPLSESDKKNPFLRDLCVLERPAGAGERKNKLSFSHYEAEGLWDKVK